MNTVRRMSRRNLRYEVVRRLQSAAATKINSSTKIEIPPKIERGPTDILQALAETIPHDPTGQPYKYVDDAYFRPRYVSQLRNFALAREWGKRAAQWVQTTHSDLFPQSEEEPKIKAFDPPCRPKTKSEASEEILNQIISECDVDAAIDTYALLEGNVSIKVKVSLLELLCFYNASQPPPEQFTEYNFYALKPSHIGSPWVNHPLIKELFAFLIEQDPVTQAAAYNALLCGCAKHRNKKEAWQLYMECMEKDIPLNVHSYNELLKSISLTRDDMTAYKRQKLVVEIVHKMLHKSVQPNVTTLNTALRVGTHSCNQEITQKYIQDMIAQFRAVNVQPSLGSYFLEISNLDDLGQLALDRIMQILKEIAGRKWEIQDMTDLNFFSGTMEMIANKLDNADAAITLHNIFCSHDNDKLIGNATSYLRYYESFLGVVLRQKPLPTFFKIYTSIVPSLHVPSLRTMSLIVGKMGTQKTHVLIQFLPRVIEDVYRYVTKVEEEICDPLIAMMVVCSNSDQAADLCGTFAEFSWKYYENLKEVKDAVRHNTPGNEASAYRLMNIIILQLKVQHLDKVSELLDCLTRQCSITSLRTDNRQIEMIFNLCLSHRLPTHAISFLEFLVGCQHRHATTYAKQLYDSLPPGSQEREKLISLVGVSALSS